MNWGDVKSIWVGWLETVKTSKGIICESSKPEVVVSMELGSTMSKSLCRSRGCELWPVWEEVNSIWREHPETQTWTIQVHVQWYHHIWFHCSTGTSHSSTGTCQSLLLLNLIACWSLTSYLWTLCCHYHWCPPLWSYLGQYHGQIMVIACN